MFSDLASRYSQLNPDDEGSIEFLCEMFNHLLVLATRIPLQMDQEVPHPVLCVLQKQWEVLATILSVYGCCEEVIEPFCALLVGVLNHCDLKLWNWHPQSCQYCWNNSRGAMTVAI